MDAIKYNEKIVFYCSLDLFIWDRDGENAHVHTGEGEGQR